MSTDLPEDLLDPDAEGDRDDAGEREDPVERQQMVVFAVGDRQYATIVDAVRTIEDVPSYTRVPRSSPAIDGVMDLRGDITVVINPRTLFGITAEEAPREEQSIIVFDRPGDRQPAGIRVDRIVDVESFAVTQFFAIDEVDAAEFGLGRDLITSVIQRFEGEEVTERIAVVDTEALVAACSEVTTDRTVTPDDNESFD